MSTAKLKQVPLLVRLVGKIFTQKPEAICETKLSKESFSLQSLLWREPSYGQRVLSNLKTLTLQAQTVAIPASPDTAGGHHAIKQSRRTSQQNSGSNKNKGKKKKFGSINFTAFKIRLFNTLYTLWANPRLRTGLIILLIIAPASKFVYLLFPQDGFGEYLINTGFLKIPNFLEPDGWFFYSVYYFIFSLSEFFTPILSTLGVFFLFPKGYYPSYLSGIPLGYYTALLINRTMVIDEADFHSGVAVSLILAMIIFAAFLLYISDKVLFRNNHRKRSIEARIIGLINMPGVSWDEKEELLKKEAKDAAKEDNELFIRVE